MGITLPWKTPDGPPVTASLMFYSREHKAMNRNYFNSYASVLLDAGESIKALSEYLGHSDPGFTLRTYTHLMPASHDRTREAVDRALYQERATDGPRTAQISDQGH